jgi:hypothetical protein
VIPVEAATTRCASEYRRRAAKLAEEAQRVRDAADRRYVLDLVAMYQRPADQMAPPPGPSPALRSAS